MTIERVTRATLAGPVLTSLKQALKRPQHFKDSKSTTLQPFHHVAAELAVSKEGLVLRGTRIVLPAQLHARAVRLAHRGHQGIVKIKQLLRGKVWFPGIDSLEGQTVKSCLACQANMPVHQRDPLTIQELPRDPWTELSVDFAGAFPDGKYAMVVVDDFSKYLVSIIDMLAAPAVIKHLRTVFAQFGCPEIVKSDNGSPFQSESFAEFASELGFKHHRITPR
ncbi:hypothetical protein MTO96_004824 [Rhipicephalus appendiculatus]